MRTFFAILALLGLLAPVSSAPALADAKAPYELNVITPLTGPGAFIGLASQKTLRIFESTVNASGGVQGRPIRFVFYDDQTNPAVAVQLTNDLLAKHVPIVLGSALSGMCKAMAPLFQSGAVEFCMSPAIYPAKGSNVFANSVSTKDLIVAMVRYWRGRGWKRIALLATTDASGQDGEAGIREALALPENKELTLVDVEHTNVSDISMTAQLSRIKASNPQEVMFWMAGTPFGTAMRGVSDVGLDVPMSSPSANMVLSQMQSYGKEVPKVLDFTGLGFAAGLASNAQSAEELRAYQSAIKAANGTNDLQTGLYWDVGLLVVSALRKLGPDATADQFRNYFLSLHGFPGITGLYDFSRHDQHGVGADESVIMRWNAAKSTWLPVSSFGGAPLN